MDILQETTISAHELQADALLDWLIESCGEIAVLNYVQRKGWHFPSDLPDQDDQSWLLLTVKHRYQGARPYVVMGRFDHYRGYWRSPAGPLDGSLEVTGWMPMPEPRTADK